MKKLARKMELEMTKREAAGEIATKTTEEDDRERRTKKLDEERQRRRTEREAACVRTVCKCSLLVATHVAGVGIGIVGQSLLTLRE